MGGLIVGAYLAAVVATLTLSGHPVLPLFEGVGPPPAYQWVKPPPQFAAGNIVPQPSAADIAFAGGKSEQNGVGTTDGQFVANFSAGAFAPHGADTVVHAAITPVDPGTLGPVPGGLVADGNAYRIQLTYRPSNTPAGTLAVAGDVIMTAPQPAQVLLYSADGKTWTKLATQTISGQSSAGAPFTRPGWYLVGASPTAALSGRHNGGLSTAVIAALVAGLAVVLAAAPVGLRALRQRRKVRPKAARAPAPASRAGNRPARSSKRHRR